jgi:iron complex outermembrane receptor protein
MKHRTASGGTLALSLFLAAAAHPSQAQTGTIAGRVREATTGVAVEGARVEVRRDTVRIGVPAITDSSGAFAVRGLEQGRYQLSVRRLGYEPASVHDVEVAASSETSIAVALRPSQTQLNPTVVTASRQTEKALDAPASVSVVTGEEVEERPVLSAMDHLRALPGLDVAGTSLISGTAVARGFNGVFSGAMLTLTDYRYAAVPSLRVNTPFLIPTANEDISRIEVVLGPGSALYGPNTANGVMHIFTRSPFESPGTTLTLGVGNRSVVRGAVRHAGTLTNNLGFKVTAQFMRGDDWEFTDPEEARARSAAIGGGANPDTLRIGNRDFLAERWTGEARVDYRFGSDAEIVASVGRASAESALEMTGIGTAQVKGWHYDYLQLRMRSGRLFAQAFANLSDAGQGSSWLLRSGQPILDRSRVLVGQLQHALDLGTRQRFTYGFDAQRTDPRTSGSISGRNENDDMIDEVGAYLHSETSLTKDLDLVTAGRVDYHSRLPNVVFSPRAALVYRPRGDQNLRFTYNRAFTTPTSTNLFLDVAVQRLTQLLPYDVRTIGVPKSGLQFARDCAGTLCMRSPFTTDWARYAPTDATGIWQPILTLLAGQRTDLSGLPAPQPNDFRVILRSLNVGTGAFDDIQPSDVRDIPELKPTITNTYELGYKGLLRNRVLVTTDVYYQVVTDFIGPLLVETPSVFVDPASLAAYLARYLPEAQAKAVAESLAPVPLGTVTPDYRLTASPDLYLSYRNFGRLDLWGADVSVNANVTDALTLAGTFSFVSDDYFSRREVRGTSDIPLNAPSRKGSLGLLYRSGGLGVGIRARFIRGFPMNSGAFVGRVAGYGLADVGFAYRPSFATHVMLAVFAQNALDNRHREFVGAPALGRLVMAQTQYSF